MGLGTDDNENVYLVDLFQNKKKMCTRTFIYLFFSTTTTRPDIVAFYPSFACNQECAARPDGREKEKKRIFK
jgi:hypothetical protein